MVDKRKVGTFVLGGLAGALAGVLFAPRSGKELRGSISSRAGEAREKSRESYFEAQERMQERLTRVREGGAGAPREEPAGDLLPGLGKSAEPEAPLDSPPVLRDVSAARPSEEPSDPEETRRRIQETRARLRARLEKPENPGPGRTPFEDRDG